MSDIETIVDGYFAMWNETDRARRKEVTGATWVPDASYVDPRFTADGHDGLDKMVAGVHAAYPGHRFRLSNAVDAHHDRARWGWEFAGPDDGAPLATGVDYAVVADDGRLQQVTGFFESINHA